MRVAVEVAHLAGAGNLSAKQARTKILKSSVAVLKRVVGRNVPDLRTQSWCLHVELAATQIATDHHGIEKGTIGNLLIRDRPTRTNEPGGNRRVRKDLAELAAIHRGNVLCLHVGMAIVLDRRIQQKLRCVAGQFGLGQVESRWRRVELRIQIVRDRLETTRLEMAIRIAKFSRILL